MTKIAVPLSHLFDRSENVKKLHGLYDCLETRPASILSNLERQTLFHADEIQPIHGLSDKDIHFLEMIKASKKDLKSISFHCSSCCSNPSKINGMFVPASNSIKYSREEMINNALKSIKKIRSIFGDKIEILVENNNFYNTPAYDHVTEPAFICEIVEKNNINFLFDNAHAAVSAHNLGLDYFGYRDSLPLNRMSQIQFCKPSIPINKKENASDTHSLPGKKEIDEIISLSRKFNVNYVIPEYYKDVDKLVSLLISLRSKLSDKSRSF
jgi:uncharacterized protein (UPF0276 family)